jgi:hypothetical protein
MNEPVTIQTETERVSDKIDHLVRTLYYKNKRDIVDSLCLLKNKLYELRGLPEKQRKAGVAKIADEVQAIKIQHS